jgi:hypothetical protein
LSRLHSLRVGYRQVFRNFIEMTDHYRGAFLRYQGRIEGPFV